MIWGDARPAVKAAVVIVFLAAVYLQLHSRYPGLLLQVALALSLELRRRMEMSLASWRR